LSAKDTSVAFISFNWSANDTLKFTGDDSMVRINRRVASACAEGATLAAIVNDAGGNPTRRNDIRVPPMSAWVGSTRSIIPTRTTDATSIMEGSQLKCERFGWVQEKKKGS